MTPDKTTTYETLLRQLNQLTPLNQRIVKMATGAYNAIHGYKVPRGIGELLQERSINYNLRGKHILELPKVNTTTYRLNSWRCTAGISEHLRTLCLTWISQILHFNCACKYILLSCDPLLVLIYF